MNSPIYTTVTNKTDRKLLIGWLESSGEVFLMPGGSYKTAKELWTLNSSQEDRKADMLYAYRKGLVDITLSVRTADGTFHEITYALDSRESAPGIQTVANAPEVSVTQPVERKDAIDSFIGAGSGKEHVVANSDESSRLARSFGIGVSDASVPEEPSVTVLKGNDIPSDDTIAVQSKSVIAGKSASVNADASADTPDFAAEFDALTADKKWNEAYELLVAEFGKDKVTFTPKAIMSLKTFENVNKKYKLTGE